MRVYIASHDRWAALHVAGVLSAAGHQIASTWHEGPASRSSVLGDAEKAANAARNAEGIAGSDALVLIASPDMVPGGKFVEAGIAIGLGKPVVVLGRRENLLMHHPLVEAVDDPREIAGALGERPNAQWGEGENEGRQAS